MTLKNTPRKLRGAFHFIRHVHEVSEYLKTILRRNRRSSELMLYACVKAIRLIEVIADRFFEVEEHGRVRFSEQKEKKVFINIL